MCGISGELKWGAAPADIATVAAITRRQHRRGEDGEGLLSFDNVTLGHRRLKIFDLSTKAQQPMFDPALGLAIVFNGAIYNYQELRGELQAKGYSFFSTSDTEVLMKAYHCWKLAMLPKIQGMFAFVIWERDSGRLILVRDRLGVKPLYYMKTSSFLRFASTLPALLTGGVDTSIDNEALHCYLTFHMVPEPLTLIKGIQKLEPGTVMIVDANGHIEKKRYWQLCFCSEKLERSQSEKEWLHRVETALTASVKRRMIADVPVGVLLSGGLDSSLLVALVAKATNAPLHTFSIGFESTPQERGDEFRYSDMVAKHFATDHTRILIETPKFNELLMECVASMSEPIASHDAVGFYLLSKEVARHVKVVQSGQGADELFAGYHWFQHMDYHDLNIRTAAESLCGRVADNTYREYLQIVTEDRRTQNIALAYIEDLCRKTNSFYLLDVLQQYESTCALSNGPLARVDNMTMAWGLEAREPFLDPELAGLASHMPASLKLGKGGKYILKKLAERVLPREIIERPKGYFPVPKLENPGEGEVDWLREVLSEDAVRRRGIFNPAYVQMLLNNPGRHKTPLGASKLWQIGVLECWLQANNIH